jgi:hypothetical protein
MIEQSYGRYIRKDFLGPLIAACPKTLGKAAIGEKTRPTWGFWEKARIPERILVEAGGIEHPPEEDRGKKDEEK